MFAEFFARADAFALGVCNGCQMLAALRELIPGTESWPKFLRNRSDQFEARLALVEVVESPSVLLKGMAGSRIPIVTAHGEGRAAFASDELLARCDASLTSLRFVTNAGETAERYPANPNGSPRGIAGLCNADGRVTIVMPHPERVFRTSQMSWHPSDWGECSPWQQLFDNARSWVVKSRSVSAGAVRAVASVTRAPRAPRGTRRKSRPCARLRTSLCADGPARGPRHARHSFDDVGAGCRRAPPSQLTARALSKRSCRDSWDGAFFTPKRAHRRMPISDVIEEGPFGSVGAMDGADAAYRDVLAAVPNGPSSSAALIGLRDSVSRGAKPRQGCLRAATRETTGRAVFSGMQGGEL